MNIKHLKQISDMAVKRGSAIQKRGIQVKERRENERIEKENTERRERLKMNETKDALAIQLNNLLDEFRDRIIDYWDTRNAIFKTDDELLDEMMAWEDEERRKNDSGGGDYVCEWEDANGNVHNEIGIILEPCIFLSPKNTRKEDDILIWWGGTGNGGDWYDLERAFMELPDDYLEKILNSIPEVRDFGNRFFADFDTWLDENYPE